jgi:hypothetical protein
MITMVYNPVSQATLEGALVLVLTPEDRYLVDLPYRCCWDSEDGEHGELLYIFIHFQNYPQIILIFHKIIYGSVKVLFAIYN